MIDINLCLQCKCLISEGEEFKWMKSLNLEHLTDEYIFDYLDYFCCAKCKGIFFDKLKYAMRKKHKFVCAECSMMSLSLNKNKKYCSTKCSHRAWVRNRKKLKSEINHVEVLC